MKKTMSLEQIEANRANARKSTGPKTAEGKAMSRMNALKHGILAREVVLRGEDTSEREGEFQSMHRQFWEHLAPVGPVETMLVERMVTTYWRLHRVLIAERGETACSVGESRLKVERLDQGRVWSALQKGDLESSASGMLCVMEALRGVRKSVEEEGELTEAELQRVTSAFGGRLNPVATALQKIREDAREMVGEWPKDALKVQRRERVLDFIDRELARCERKLPAIEERERHEEQARRDASFLPTAAVVDKILRYEGSLERQLYRAMNQLERLQRARRGEVVPPPLTMEVSGG
jgi:hypothetical protein